MTTVPTKSSFKFPSPEAFDGKSDSRSGGSKAREFYQKCEVFFSVYPDDFDTAIKKARFVLFLCKDSAYAWASAFMEALADSQNPLQTILTNHDNFKKAFLAQFASIDLEQSATLELFKLEQSGKISEYAARFRELSSQTKWNEESKIARFYSGLNDRLKDTIATAPIVPKSLEEYVNWTISLGDRLEARNVRKPGNFQFQRRRPPNPTSRGQSAIRPDNQRPRMSQEELERHRRENRCFKCHKVSHRGNDHQFHPRSLASSGSTNPSGPANPTPAAANAMYGNRDIDLEEPLGLDAANLKGYAGALPWEEYESIILPSDRAESWRTKN